MIFSTLKNRLVVVLLVGGIFITTLTIWGVGFQVRHQLLEQLDHSLMDKMRLIRSSCIQRKQGVHVELSPNLFERIHDASDPEYIRLSLLEPEPRVILESPTLEGIDWEIKVPDSESPEVHFVELPDGRKLRAASQRFVPPRESGVGEPVTMSLWAAHGTERVEAAYRRIAGISFVAGVASLLLLAILIRVVVGRNLRFFQELSGCIREVSLEESVEGGIRLENAPSEMMPVIARLNELMARMDRALKNERRFTADAAHELRTPLAGLRNRIELALSRPRSGEDYQQALIEVLAIEDWLERLVQSLLLLARLEAGTQRIDYEPLPVTDLIRRSWKPYFERAEESDFEVELVCAPVFEPPRPLPIELLEIVCRNLFDNALSYTQPGGTIRVTVSETQPDLSIEVCNEPVTDESMMPIEEVFVPFSRGAQSSDVSERHSGIGLALCRRIVRSLDGEIEALRPDEQAFRVFVRIPIAYEREIEDETMPPDQAEDLPGEGSAEVS